MRLTMTFTTLALLGLGTAHAAGPATSAQLHWSPYGTAVTIRHGAPPPPRYESMPRARPGHVWMQGHWAPRGPRYVWVPGRWAAQRPGYLYRAPHWQQHHGRWDWRPGGWVQTRPYRYR